METQTGTVVKGSIPRFAARLTATMTNVRSDPGPGSARDEEAGGVQALAPVWVRVREEGPDQGRAGVGKSSSVAPQSITRAIRTIWHRSGAKTIKSPISYHPPWEFLPPLQSEAEPERPYETT